MTANPSSPLFQHLVQRVTANTGDVCLHCALGLVADLGEMRRIALCGQEEIAEILGAPLEIVQAMEMGWIVLSLRQAMLIAQSLGMPLAAFFGDEYGKPHYITALAQALELPL